MFFSQPSNLRTLHKIMLEDITLYEFNSLNDNEKHEDIMEYATHVAERFEAHTVYCFINLTK